MSVKRIFIPDQHHQQTPAPSMQSQPANDVAAFVAAAKTLYRTKILDGEVYELMRASAREILPHIHPWAFNRQLDPDHVRAMHAALVTTRHPFLLGTFKFVHVVPEARVYMIDGQHRHAALQQAVHDDPDFDMKIVLELYHLRAPNDVAIQHMFEKANNSLSMSREQAPNRFLISFVNALCSDPELNPNSQRPNIVDLVDADPRSRVNRPRISKKALANAVQASPAYGELIVMDVPDAVERVRQVNAWLSTLSTAVLLGADNDAARRRRASAGHMGFFLNLGGRWGPDKWVPLLVQAPETWTA